MPPDDLAKPRSELLAAVTASDTFHVPPQIGELTAEMQHQGHEHAMHAAVGRGGEGPSDVLNRPSYLVDGRRPVIVRHVRVEQGLARHHLAREQIQLLKGAHTQVALHCAEAQDHTDH